MVTLYQLDEDLGVIINSNNKTAFWFDWPQSVLCSKSTLFNERGLNIQKCGLINLNSWTVIFKKNFKNEAETLQWLIETYFVDLL